jgi:uncharacterized protein (DUF1330 family)|tara:strand:- start:684 stop:998 length:315 start_codon:yes stop_codon:yes gene_type:complete
MTRKVFIVANLPAIKDREKFKDYERGLLRSLGRHEGVLDSFSDDVFCLEGDNPPKGRIVIFHFPSMKHAEEWWADEEYQKASDIRRENSVTDFIVRLEELPPRA